MFRVVYPAAVSIDANDFNEAFKTAIKRQQFFNVEQMIIADQLNQYRRANIMYSDLGEGKKKARIAHQEVPYSTVAPYLGVTIGADGTAQPGMAMPLGPGLPPIIFPLGGQKKEEPAAPAAAATAATAPAADAAKPAEPAKDRVVMGPMGAMLVPAGGNVSASVVLPGSNQLVGVKPSFPIGTDGKPVAGLPMPFGFGGVPLMRPGLVPGSGTPMAMFPGAIPMGRVW